METAKTKLDRSVRKARRSTASAKGSQGTDSLIKQIIDQSYPPNSCPLCDNEETTRTKAEQHYRSSHKGKQGYMCMDPECEQGFSCRAGLQYHLHAAHTFKREKDNVVIATRKNKLTSSKLPELHRDLTQELQLHYNPLVCPRCKEEFTKKTQTIVHISNNHPKEKLFKCFVKHCPHDQGFGSLVALIYHLAKH
ncbi:hypothetical protein BC941DRAFT_464908 [Chlamydoabsidia padenii]|nr:hypothetical protein BC941DRAFT_464908 [Chlamydoabsidia padenii]